VAYSNSAPQQAREVLKRLIANIRKTLSHVGIVAEQMPAADRWKILVDYLMAEIIPALPPRLFALTANHAG
jgi:hypothetical protein